MKFVIYRDAQKITIENAMVPDMQSIENLTEELVFNNLKIMSTRGMLMDGDEFDDEEIEKEIFYGINWTAETVN